MPKRVEGSHQVKQGLPPAKAKGIPKEAAVFRQAMGITRSPGTKFTATPQPPKGKLAGRVTKTAFALFSALNRPKT